MKNIGIVGGLGPETTSKFYLELLYKSFQLKETQRPPILIWSIPMDYKTESDFILGDDKSLEYIEYLKEAVRRLEAGGVDFIVIPCNSVHIFLDQISEEVSIPILSIVEETRKFLKKNNLSKVGLLATTASIKNELYQKELKANAIDIVLPTNKDQQKMGEIINKLVRDEYSEIQKRELLKIISRLADKNLDAVLLACTDLQLLEPQHDSVKIIDTMRILVDSTVKMSLNL